MNSSPAVKKKVTFRSKDDYVADIAAVMTSEISKEELSTNILMDATVDNIEESPLGVEKDDTSSSDTGVKEGPVEAAE